MYNKLKSVSSVRKNRDIDAALQDLMQLYLLERTLLPMQDTLIHFFSVAGSASK
jgi:hypothetical protein